MLIQIKAGKVIGKFEDGTVLEEAKGVKVFDGPEGLAVLRMSGMVKLHNNLVDEGNMVKGFESIDQACATTWDAMVNFEIPEPVAKGKKEKAAKEPRQPKVYNIEPKDEAHEYKEGTKMRQMVDALVEGATFADLATLIDTKVENVQHRVLRLMPQAGYGIYNTAEDPKTFFITIPPYKVKPVSEAAAKKAEEKAAKEAEKEAKAAEKAAAKAEKEAAKAAEKEAKAKEKEEAKKAKEAEKEAKAKEKAE